MKPFRINFFPVGIIETNCILIQLREHSRLYIIDPGGEGDRILSRINEFQYDDAVILLTHAHFDHIHAAGQVARALQAPVYLNPPDAGIYRSPLNEYPPYLTAATDLPDTVWPLEDPEIEVIPCPGHTPGGVAYYFRNAGVVCSGDTLFYMSVGRSDFPGGDFSALMVSVRERLFHLPGNTRVLPGHGAETSISFETAHNPYTNDDGIKQ